MRLTAYDGNESYIFISYAHKDADRVVPILNQLQEDGYRIWFDEGIIPGSEWDEMIADHALTCRSFIAFLSESYLSSDNCRDELNFVRDLKKDRLLVYLEELELPAGMKLRLDRLQALHWYKYADHPEVAMRKLESAEGVRECREQRPAVEEVPALTESDPTNAKESSSVDEATVERGNIFSRQKNRIIAGTLALVCAASALGIGMSRGNQAKETAEESAYAAETEEAVVSKEVKANRWVKVTLTANEEMSINGFTKAVEQIRARMDILDPDQTYTMSVDGDQIQLKFSGDILHGKDVTTFLRAYVSRPMNLYLVDNEEYSMDRAESFSADDIESLESCEIPDEEALAAGIGEDQPYLKMVLTKEVAERAKALSTDSAFYLVQDYTDDYTDHSYCQAYLGADDRTLYIDNNGEIYFHEILIYNWTHDPLEKGFTFSIEDDVNLWADWEDPAAASIVGENQVAFDEVPGDTCTVAYGLFYDTEEVSSGQWLDTQTVVKERLDVLGCSYAFGIYDEHNIVIKVPADHLGEDVLKLIFKSNSYIWTSVYFGDYSKNVDIESVDYEKLEDGNYELIVRFEELEELESLSTMILENTDSFPVSLLGDYWDSDVMYRGNIEAPVVDGIVRFTEKQYGESDSISEEDLWIVQLYQKVLETNTDIPSYTFKGNSFSSEDADYGVRNNKIEEFVKALQEEFPDVQIRTDSNLADILCEFFLPVDESMVESGTSRAKEIIRFTQSWDPGPIQLGIVLIEEDDDISERARIYYCRENGIFFRSDDYEEPKEMVVGYFYGGRLEPYKEAFYQTVSTDEFYVNLALGYSESVEDAWVFEKSED